MLQLEELSRRYGEIVALDRLSLTVPPGQLFGLLGPNGAGKSTAMRIVFGLARADRGKVLWKGRPVGQAERRQFGYLPEERGLYPKMRVREQLVYLARLHGLAKGAALAAADTWIDRLGVSTRADDKVEALSLGTQQLAARACCWSRSGSHGGDDQGRRHRTRRRLRVGPTQALAMPCWRRRRRECRRCYSGHCDPTSCWPARWPGVGVVAMAQIAVVAASCALATLAVGSKLGSAR